jgi:hypothetical protein
VKNKNTFSKDGLANPSSSLKTGVNIMYSLTLSIYFIKLINSVLEIIKAVFL